MIKYFTNVGKPSNLAQSLLLYIGYTCFCRKSASRFFPIILQSKTLFTSRVSANSANFCKFAENLQKIREYSVYFRNRESRQQKTALGSGNKSREARDDGIKPRVERSGTLGNGTQPNHQIPRGDDGIKPGVGACPPEADLRKQRRVTFAKRTRSGTLGKETQQIKSREARGDGNNGGFRFLLEKLFVPLRLQIRAGTGNIFAHQMVSGKRERIDRVRRPVPFMRYMIRN